MTFDQFISQAKPLNRAWVTDGNLDIYVRLALHNCQGSGLKTLDLANFEIADEDLRGQGEFTRFLEKAERVAKELERTVYVESIMNDRLLGFLIRRGYRLVDQWANPAPSVFLPSE